MRRRVIKIIIKNEKNYLIETFFFDSDNNNDIMIYIYAMIIVASIIL